MSSLVAASALLAALALATTLTSFAARRPKAVPVRVRAKRGHQRRD